MIIDILNIKLSHLIWFAYIIYQLNWQMLMNQSENSALGGKI